MGKKSGGVIDELLGKGISAGTYYYAYKNSDSYGGFLWLRLKYGLMLLLFVAAIIGIPFLLLFTFGKKTPMNPQNSTSSYPSKPSK